MGTSDLDYLDAWESVLCPDDETHKAEFDSAVNGEAADLDGDRIFEDVFGADGPGACAGDGGGVEPTAPPSVTGSNADLEDTTSLRGWFWVVRFCIFQTSGLGERRAPIPCSSRS